MIRLDASLRRWARCVFTSCLRAALATLWFVAVGAAAALPALRIPEGEAAKCLRLFARQAGVQIVFPADEVRGFRTNEVRGHLEPRDALALLLQGSGLTFVEDAATGSFVVRKGPPAAAGNDGQMPPVSGQPAKTAHPGAADEDAEVVLSPFEIQTRSDRGYRSASSVSATRIAAPIRTLPMTVSAFTEEFITDLKPYDLYDVVKWTPGVHQDNLSPQGWARYAVRGFTAASIQRNGFGSFRFIDTTNIARVEVVKGPYSLLYGQINPGGVINYVTKRPQERAFAEISASAGSHGYARLVIDGTGPVPGTEGTVLARGLAMTESIQRFQQGSRGSKVMLAPSVRWKIGGRATLTLDYERFERHEDMLTGGVPLIYANGAAVEHYPGLPWDFSYAGRGDYQDFVSDALTLELEASIADDVHLRAAYLDSGWDMEWRATGQGATGLISQAAIDYYYPSSTGLTPRDAMIRRNRWELQQGDEQSLQLDLSGDFAVGTVQVKPLVGLKRVFETAQRSRQNNNSTTPGRPTYIRPWDLRDPGTWDRAVPFGGDALTPVADINSSSAGTSVYGVLSLSSADERWHVLAGYAWHQIENHPTTDHVAGTFMPAVTRSEDVPQVGGLYRVNEHVSLFATYSESFLANPTLLRVNNRPTAPAAPSIGFGWEAGLKLEAYDGRLSGTVSTYSIRARPAAIVTVTSGIDPNGTTLFTDIQGGAQASTGFEAEFSIEPVRGLDLYVSIGTCDAVYTRHPTNPAFDGARLVAAPDRVASVWGKYTFARRGDVLFSMTGGFNHVGSMVFVGNNPRATLPAYTTADLGLGCSFRLFERGWSADILVKNIADKRYYVSNSSWGFPRHAIMTLSTRF